MMGSTNYLTKAKSAGYRAKSGSSAGSDKEMNGKLKRTKIRRPTKIPEFGLKRVPDYTELAYKEAVGKLRYFLSGNYAPSVRSYGGGSASIKNLDETDADLDKKYSPYSHALTEYKPRPRLTAKYTTLYADSLNNYTPPQHISSGININPTTVPPAAASPVDVTGGTNPDVVNFIQKQEEYIEQLERESQYCRDELNNLLGKVKEVISENEHLHEAQKNKLITRMFHSYAGSETDDLDDVGDSTGLDSDNKLSPSKTRKTAKSRSTRLEGPNIVFESRIAELEAQLTQSKIDLKKVQEENNEIKRKLASGLVDSTCLDGFKRQIDNLQRDKSALESQISKLKLSLESRDDGYKRSDGLENQLREERNNLEAELRRLKDDLAKERSKVRELAGEGARRAIQERSAAEQRYNAHFDEMQHDLAAQYDTVAKLQLELERNRREENELKRELSMKNNVIDELKMELKNKTAALQADLAQAHAEKASLDEELASARLTIERHQRQSKHEINRLNSEIQSLRQRLDRADADLVHSRRENLRLSEQISNLEKELNMKTLTPITPEKTKKDKELATMLDSIENKHAKTVAELESMIQSQNSLMEKLTGECRLLTDKLDDANRRHKTDRTQLLCRNNELMRKLRNLWCSHKKYCTTTVPLRSYTPLSGYPNSRSSYDLERTYYTSTPYTNRFRRPESRFSYDFGHLTRCLSDLSIDRIDSDDDPAKVRELQGAKLDLDAWQELATLQRQVDSLGRSFQASPRTAPNYTAPATHATPAERVLPAPVSSRPVDPRVESPSHTAGDSALQSLGDHQATRELTKEPSKTSLYNNPQPKITHDEPTTQHKKDTKLPDNHKEPAEIEQEEDEIMEVEQPQTDYQAQNYEEHIQSEPVTEPKYEAQGYDNQPMNETEYETQQYDTQPANKTEYQPQEYEQEQPENVTEYQNQDYDQNYEQPAYTEGQYENYEQYPQQYADPNAQYEPDPNAYETDPNAQYEGDPSAQYENYAPDGNYTTEQNYDTTQHSQEYQETPQLQAQGEEKGSKDTVPSQS